MRNWKFENGIEVYEVEFDCALHCFVVYNNDDYLGTIYPNTLKDMEECILNLDNGDDPISDGWEDGLGHVCTLEGWEN